MSQDRSRTRQRSEKGVRENTGRCQKVGDSADLREHVMKDFCSFCFIRWIFGTHCFWFWMLCLMYSMALHQAVRSESSICFICQILAQPAAFRLPLGVLAVEHGCAEAGCRGPAGWAASEEQNTSARCLRAPDHGVDAGRVIFFMVLKRVHPACYPPATVTSWLSRQSA